MRSIYYILVFILLIGCSNEKLNYQTISNKIDIVPNLDFTSTDTVFVNLINNHKIHRRRTFHEGICFVKDDTTNIIFTTGAAFTGNTFIIKTTDSLFYIDFVEWSCTYVRKYKNLNHKIAFNKEILVIDDTLIASIDYKCFYLDTSDNFSDTATIFGIFKLPIKGDDYSFEKQLQEERWNTFIKETNSNQRLDTIIAIDLSRLDLENIPPEVYKYKNLEKLDLGYNNLKSDSFTKLNQFHRLKYLNLRHNKLEEFPEAILQLSNLEELDVFTNDITSLPDRLFSLKNLKRLTLESNELTEISPLICNLIKLEMLSISGTNIKRLPDCIIKLERLKTMYIPRNMEYFPKELAYTLSNAFNYSNIGNYYEFKNLIPKD